MTGTFTLTLANTITVDGSQGQSSTSFSGLDTDYTLTVSNPCPTTTVAAITFSPSSITVEDGSTATSEFVIPSDAVDDAASPLQYLCGTKTYAITDSNGAAVSTWAVITDSATEGSKTLTITPGSYGSDITASVSETLTITTELADWGANSGSTATIAVTLNPITCSCAALAWSAPTAGTTTVAIDASVTPTLPVPTSSTSATSSTPAFARCYMSGGAGCATTGSYASGDVKYDDNTNSGTSLPSWITYDGTTLTVAPDATS